MKTKTILLIASFALAAVLAGCGGGATYSDVDTSSPTPETNTATGKTVIPKVTGSADSKPEIGDAKGKPPSKMVVKDLKKGSGTEAEKGDKVTVNYVGHNWSDGTEFDASWGKKPFTFTIGQGEVIKGWDQGVVGMKEGGRRLLVIPPDLGYGAQGQGEIPANETLVFVIDLVKVD